MKKLYEETDVQAIADAIREKTGKTDKMKIAEMSGEIEGVDLNKNLSDFISDKIIDYKDDITVKQRNYSFFACEQLQSVYFKKLLESGYCGFNNCYNLKIAKFEALTYLNGAIFGGSGIKTLVISTPTICEMLTIDALMNTPIYNGTGYIYVPKSLIEGYKVATNWSAYADQFRALEDYTVDGTTTGELDESKI